MKFNFRKVACVLASAVMLTSTVGFAAASTYPAPFNSGGGAVVFGAKGDPSDMSAAITIYDSLKGTSTGGTTTTPTGSAIIETGGQKQYLGDYLNGTKSALTKSDLPVMLADGKIIDTDGTSFDYNQKINTPITFIDYGKTSDSLTTPVLYVSFEDASKTITEDIIFPTAVNLTKFAGKDITILGKKYTFSGSISQVTSTSVVLYESAQSELIAEAESKEVTVAGTAYTIAVSSVESDTKATITVNGVSQSVTEESSYKVSGLDIYVKNVMGPNVAGSARAVELSLGSAKLTLTDGTNPTKGSKTIYGVTTTFTNSSGKVSKISNVITPYNLDTQIKYLKSGNSSFTEPIFGAFKMTFSGAEPDLTDSSKDIITIKPSSETKANLKFTNKVGHEYNLNMFRASTGTECGGTAQCNVTGSASYNASTLGVDTYSLIVDSGTNATVNSYFITGSGQYTQIFRLTQIDTNNKRLVVRDSYTGNEGTQTLSLASDNTTSLTLDDGSTATFIMNISGNGAGLTSRNSSFLFTKGGAKIELGYANAPKSNESRISITEETAYNDGSYTRNDGSTTLGGVVNVTFGTAKTAATGFDMAIISTVASDGFNSGAASTAGVSVGDYDSYFLTRYGTFVKQTGNTDKTVDVYYPKSSSAMKVYVGDVGTTITPGTGGTTTTGNIKIVNDGEIDSVKDMNLIVVGGSCINEAALKIVDATATDPICGEDWTLKTNVAANQWIIKTVKSPYNDAKIAMLVAGFEKAETVSAKETLLTGTGIKTDVDTSQVYPILAT